MTQVHVALNKLTSSHPMTPPLSYDIPKNYLISILQLKICV